MSGNEPPREYIILDRDDSEMPRHHSGQLRTFAEAAKMVDRLNRSGEYAPYKKKKLINHLKK